jgi:sulfate adenylyltransferase subunit 1 (EFTu-like GTPase family)
LFRGRAYTLMLGTRSVSATVTDIVNRLHMDTLAVEPVRELHLNEIG